MNSKRINIFNTQFFIFLCKSSISLLLVPIIWIFIGSSLTIILNKTNYFSGWIGVYWYSQLWLWGFVLPITIFTLVSMPSFLLKLRETSLIKRFGISRISRLSFYITLIFYELIALFLLFGTTTIIYLSVGVFDGLFIFTESMGMLFLSFFQYIIVFLFTGIVIGMFVSSQAKAILTGITIILISLVFGYMLIDYRAYGGPGEFIFLMGMITPWTLCSTAITWGVTSTAYHFDGMEKLYLANMIYTFAIVVTSITYIIYNKNVFGGIR